MVMGATEQRRLSFKGDGIIIFNDVADAMKAEKVIKGAGYELKLVAPPPQMRMGCDLALEINLVEQPGIERVMKAEDVAYKYILPLTKNSTQVCEVVKITDFGRWTMVKAGNMKLSYEKASGRIVNISGGGCPDIPYLNVEMVGKNLMDAPQPRELGYTLCATMLQRAYEEALALHGEGK
jgi:hypothetical protein